MSDLSSFHMKIKQSLQENYPNLNTDLDKYLNVFSPNTVELDHSILQQIKNFVSVAFKLSRHENLQKQLFELYPEKANNIYKKAPNQSVLMSYDFHITDQHIKLIEINTNASSFTIGNVISELQHKKSHIEAIKQSFHQEIKHTGKKQVNLAIIDDCPSEQKLYLEFLLYKELFKRWGHTCSIIDVDQLQLKNGVPIDSSGTPIDFIYNRYCDFYLEEDRSKQLLEAYLNQKVILSPQPKEYFLLADKQRMTDWQTLNLDEYINSEEQDILFSTLLESRLIKHFDAETLWQNKKKYFFKPAQSFGGKSAYRGKNITKKVFQRLLNENTLVQEYAAPGTIEAQDQKWKYDLRVYCYQDKIDQIVARTYQGQTTNASTLGGGISLVTFN